MRLRKLNETDIPYMMEWMHDSEITCNFRADFKNMQDKQVLNFISNSFTEWNQNFAIVDGKNEYMGTISLKNISEQNNNAEYAIVTRRCAHGTGLAYRATEDIFKYAFLELGLHRVYLNVLERNKRARNFYEKCGFLYEGRFMEHIYIDNKYENLVWYGINHKRYLNNVKI